MKLKSGEPAYFDLARASAYTGGGLSVRTLRRFIAQGRLPAFRPGGPGGKILIRRTDLERLVESFQASFDLDDAAAKIVREMQEGGQCG